MQVQLTIENSSRTRKYGSRINVPATGHHSYNSTITKFLFVTAGVVFACGAQAQTTLEQYVQALERRLQASEQRLQALEQRVFSIAPQTSQAPQLPPSQPPQPLQSLFPGAVTAGTVPPLVPPTPPIAKLKPQDRPQCSGNDCRAQQGFDRAYACQVSRLAEYDVKKAKQAYQDKARGRLFTHEVDQKDREFINREGAPVFRAVEAFNKTKTLRAFRDPIMKTECPDIIASKEGDLPTSPRDSKEGQCFWTGGYQDNPCSPQWPYSSKGR